MTTPDIAGLCKKLRFSETCISTLAAEVDRLTDTLERQAAEIERLREALEFYADEDNWFGVYMTGCGPMADDWSIDGHPYWPDGKPGKTARVALTGEDQ